MNRYKTVKPKVRVARIREICAEMDRVVDCVYSTELSGLLELLKQVSMTAIAIHKQQDRYNRATTCAAAAVHHLNKWLDAREALEGPPLDDKTPVAS